MRRRGRQTGSAILEISTPPKKLCLEVGAPQLHRIHGKKIHFIHNSQPEDPAFGGNTVMFSLTLTRGACISTLNTSSLEDCLAPLLYPIHKPQTKLLSPDSHPGHQHRTTTENNPPPSSLSGSARSPDQGLSDKASFYTLVSSGEQQAWHMPAAHRIESDTRH